MENAPQSNPFTNAEPMRLTIVYAQPEEIQQVHPEKTIKNSNQEKIQQLHQEKGKSPRIKLGK